MLPDWLASIAQNPVPLSIVTVELVTPPDTIADPNEQTVVLAASTDSVTANPEVDCAATGKALL